MLDTHPAVVDQLDRDLVGWLTTVNGDDQPQSSPIWFLREGNDLVMYSRADAKRLDNLATNPKVAFNLRGDEQGDTVVTLEGKARIDPDAPSALDVPAYVDKYGDEMIRLGWTHESFAVDYSVAIRIVATRLRSG